MLSSSSSQHAVAAADVAGIEHVEEFQHALLVKVVSHVVLRRCYAQTTIDPFIVSRIELGSIGQTNSNP